MRPSGFLFAVLFSAIFALSGKTLHALNPGNDFNGDGYSDIALVSVADGGALNWQVLSGVDAQTLLEQQAFGVAGNHLAPARWINTSTASLARLSLSGSNVTWRVLLDGSQVRSRRFGKKKDTLISGGDFDGDGLADAVAVTEMPDGRLRWTVRRDFLSGLSESRLRARRVRGLKVKSKVTRYHGEDGDTPFYYSYDGKRDWAAVLKDGGARVDLMNIHSGRVKRIKLKNVNVGNLRPLPLKSSAGRDRLAFIERGSESTEIDVVSWRGRVLRSVELSGTGEILTGRFTSLTHAQIALQDDAEYTVYDAVAGGQESRTWADGIAVDDVNINQFESESPSPTATPDNWGTPIENPAPPAGSITSICTNLQAVYGNRNVLYKPSSQDTGDARENKPLFMWYEAADNPWVRNLYILAANGEQIAVFGYYYVRAATPWVRFYSGHGSGTGKTGAQLRSLARAAAGSSAIYLYTEDGNCWGPVADPRNRTGGR